MVRATSNRISCIPHEGALIPGTLQFCKNIPELLGPSRQNKAKARAKPANVTTNEMTQEETQAKSTLDDEEVRRFEEMAKAWWDPEGKFRPLHQIGPARLSFIRTELLRHFSIDDRTNKPLTSLKILDVGCGGGLISEPLCRLGGDITGIDPGERNIRIARSHAEPQGLEIDYQTTTVEDLVRTGATFDAVICLEVVEHVPDVPAFVQALADLTRPGGMMIVSTINRNLKSFALAIVAAEYVLQWLPRGTHQWDRFITPDELATHLAEAEMAKPTFKGFTYNPLTDVWSLADDTSVNYLASSAKPPAK